MHELPSEKVMGKTDFEIFPQPVAERRNRDHLHTLQFRQPTTLVDTIGTRYNGFKPYRMQLMPIRVHGEENPTYLAGITLAPLAHWQDA